MNLRDRLEPEHERGPETPPDRGDASDTAALREDGQTLLAAADAAINRALSGNSAEFLVQNRQLGGQ